MKSIKTYLVVWLSGVIAGLILMERWQGTGGPPAPAADDAGGAVGADAAANIPASQPGVTAVVVAGAKADAERARQLLGRVVPWGSAPGPSLAQLRRAGRSAPAATPGAPAD